MAFRFSLQALLRVRQSLEKAELQRLQIIAAHAVRVRAAIESVDAEQQAAKRSMIEAAAAGISGAELRFEALRDAAFAERRAALVKKLAEIEKLRREQQARYLRVRQQREILSELRERQFAAYRAEQARREQQQIDELFLIRRGVARRVRKQSVVA